MLQDSIRQTLQTLKNFFRHPLDEIARLPEWSLQHVLITQVCIAAASGILSSLFHPGIWRVLQGMILFPLLVAVMSLLLTSFFYYYFQIFERRTVSFLRLFTVVTFSGFPFFLFHIASRFFPPADVFGLGMMALLLVIGLAENFSLNKKRSLRLIAVIFGLLFALWLMERISANRVTEAESPEEISSL